MKKTLIIISLFLCIPALSQAATIYANSSTGNDTNDGSIGNPVATFHKAYTLVSSGDTINLTGNFTLSSTTETGDAITSGYTISKSIEILGNGPDQTSIQSSTTTADRRVFTLSSAATTTIRNLAIKNGRISSSNDGGCILNSGTTTIINVEVYSCTTTADYGGGISNRGTMNISSSTIYSNSAFYGGGGIAQNFSATGNLIATNNTIYGNSVTASGGAFYGAGVYAGSKIVTLTNNTITANTNTSGLGSGLYAAGIVYLKNNIIAHNIATSYPGNADYHYASGSTTSSGYNIIGRASTYNWSSTGDWTDANGDGTFVLVGAGTTGSVNLDTALSLNDSSIKTKTLRILTGSIAINNGGSGTNSTTSVPTTDQRGATRNSTLDIGAFEYDGGGITVSAPSTQASNISFTLNGYNRLNLSWVNGNGVRRTVFMKQASSGTASPVDGTLYTANSIFGSGSQIGSSGWYSVYDGYGTSVSVTNLVASTPYTVHITEYNGIGTGASKYNIDSAVDNSLGTTTYTPTIYYINSSTGSDSNSGSSGSPFATFGKGYTSAQSGDTLNMSGTFTWTDAAETGDVTIAGYTLTKDLTIVGQGAQNTIIQASSTDNTADRRIFTVSNSTTTVTLKDLTLRYGKVASSAHGGCYTSAASTTIQNVEMYSCRSTGGYGGAVHNGGFLHVFNSSFYNNTVYYGGGGIAAYSTATNTVITNSTFYSNLVTSSGGAFYGGGVYIATGNSSLTNNTITANTVTNGLGGGLQFYNTANFNYLRNNLIASNTASTYTGTSDFHTYTANANITSNYNIIGRAETYGWSSTGDWTDSNGDRTFVLNTTGTTGTVNFDTAASLGTSLTGTKTWPVLVSSIAINRGTTGANGSTSIPALDQRGAARNGATDIGAYEYGGSIIDTTGPSISSIASSTSATTATITWTTDESATSTVFYGTTSSYGLSSTTLTAGTSHSFSLSGLTAATVYYFYASSTDASGNTSTSSQQTFLTAGGVTPTSIEITTATTTATITWTTADAASTKVSFGPTTNLGSTTIEKDISPRVTSHSMTLVNLPRCALLNFTVTSRSTGDTATSSNATFTTKGCVGGGSITSSQFGAITTSAGGSVTNDRMTINVPTSFTSTSSAATFQAHKLDATTFFSTAGNPTGKNRAGSTVFNLKALTDATTTLSSFTAPVEVSLTYEDSEITNIDEDSLWMYRYDGTDWNPLSNCTVAKNSNTVTCTTTQFSDFSLFGDEGTNEEDSNGDTEERTTRSSGSIVDRYNNLIKIGNEAAAITLKKQWPQLFPIEERKIAQTVTIPSITSVRDLEYGMSGDDVKEIQNLLISKNTGPKARALMLAGATGYFGPMTKAAVIEFQLDRAIYPPYGYFGPRTRASLK